MTSFGGIMMVRTPAILLKINGFEITCLTLLPLWGKIHHSLNVNSNMYLYKHTAQDLLLNYFHWESWASFCLGTQRNMYQGLVCGLSTVPVQSDSVAINSSIRYDWLHWCCFCPLPSVLSPLFPLVLS